MTTVVELDRVSKSFGDQSVLRELSFSIEQGEIFCLLGPNGAGKTTTLEILEGFLEPDFCVATRRSWHENSPGAASPTRFRTGGCRRPGSHLP